MELTPYLRMQIKRVRDGFGTTPSQRKRLYAFLKLNKGWKNTSVMHKLGGSQYRWLEELEAYGDENGWLDEGIALAVKEVS